MGSGLIRWNAKLRTVLRYLALAALLFSIGSNAFAQEPDNRIRMYTLSPRVDIVLRDPYGVLLVNDGDEKNPSPRYILAIRKSRKVVDTTDRDVFIQALQEIPKDSRLIRHDSCTVPRSYGLTRKQKSDFERMIRNAGLGMPQSKMRITCYCEKDPAEM